MRKGQGYQGDFQRPQGRTSPPTGDQAVNDLEILALVFFVLSAAGLARAALDARRRRGRAAETRQGDPGEAADERHDQDLSRHPHGRRRAEQRFQRIETKLDNIDSRFDAFERHVDKRFDALKRKLDGRFRGIDGRLVTFEQDLDEGFRRVRERIDSLERRLAKKNPGREQEQTKPEQGAPDGDAGPGCAGRCGAKAVADPRARPEPRGRGTASHASKVRLRRGPDFEVLANGANAG